ncbi:helix-turn-helix transcriptional regulator [Chroococcidiopsis sp. CCNUC1]|uniref:helix-turn-helix transcriptional regulator n=1 Tax=Chroococcidiopsis sp. CCNUC1 TaxID=2653189 RepID=UPI002021005D|nr:helix-turn-helix transcriptional regulator [Chroococcidiopsis sp. CCNUC1]URD47651.1 helix-turn-helix transcriptional regulator [Chroococcidiopsis sp. CCNUC1]
MVGLSDRKLRRGFRDIFGTTVFGYLHDYRMEQARLLLSVNKMRVADVAQTVGYSHLGHFIASFKRKFGITPKNARWEKSQVPLLGYKIAALLIWTWDLRFRRLMLRHY